MIGITLLRPQYIVATPASVATSAGFLVHRGFRKTGVSLRCDLLAEYLSQFDIFLLFFSFKFQFIHFTLLIIFKLGCQFIHLELVPVLLRLFQVLNGCPTAGFSVSCVGG